MVGSSQEGASTSRFCSQCGAPLHGEAAFCSSCGAKVKDPEPTPLTALQQILPTTPTAPPAPLPQPVPAKRDLEQMFLNGAAIVALGVVAWFWWTIFAQDLGYLVGGMHVVLTWFVVRWAATQLGLI